MAARAVHGPLAFVLLVAACTKGGDLPPALSCPGDQVACGEQCLSVAADPMNCGGCGIPCPTDQMCQGGTCHCLSGTLCNGTCVSPDAGSCNDEAAGTLGSPPVLVTSAPGGYWKTDGQLTEVTAGNADVIVRDTSTAQIWEGFGGAFNERGWSALSALSPGDRDAAIRLIYGADGARFAFGRIPIGGTDYALDRYTLDETAGDTSLATFSIDRDMQMLIPFVRAAQSVKGNIRFWATPWTPPTWMKQGPFSSGSVVSPFDGGAMKSDDATMDALARYLIKFVLAYAEQGIHIEAVSPQNEPSYTGNYPTCRWSPAIYARFVGQYLGPAISSAGLTTKVILGTFNDPGPDPAIVSDVLADDAARGYIKAFGFQWGMRGHVAGARAYSLPVWQTEHQAGNYPWAAQFNPASAPNDQAYAVESWGLIRDWIRAGVTSYSAWNMVLDTTGVSIDSTRPWPQNALLTVDVAAKTLSITPTYYVFRHISQFVAPGAKVAATSGGDALAFQNTDGSVVAVMYNARPERTMTVGIAGKKLQFSMPGNGWATVVSR